MTIAERLSPDSLLRHFTTSQAVRAGVLQATWSVAPSLARGLLPRSPGQQAMVTGAVVTANYFVGESTWSAVSGAMAGLPGHRAGPRALLVGAAGTAVVGGASAAAMRRYASRNMPLACAWATARTVGMAGAAGALVTVGDLVAHDLIGLKRSPASTLALDMSTGGGMAALTMVLRQRRARAHAEDNPTTPLVAATKGGTWLRVAGMAAGTAIGIAAVASTEQAAAQRVTDAANRAAGRDLGDASEYLGHTATALGFTALGLVGLRLVRARTHSEAATTEDIHDEPPASRHVSGGPASLVDFGSIGKEGRRFVSTALEPDVIEAVMMEPGVYQHPVRAVISESGPVAERADLAVRELEALGGLERSLICVASPTGVGYVNYVMAEALEYLTRGNCAVIVPQYALVPSALALNKTKDGTKLQRAVLRALQTRIQALPESRRPRVVQFGESLGAQVALDVIEGTDTSALADLGVDSGLYLGVPFRSSTWRRWCADPAEVDPQGRLVLVADADDLRPAPGQHAMVVHHDDPVNKFAYSMVVKPPDWMGPAESRPPLVPRETRFRPLSTFAISLVDLLNGMNSQPGVFKRVGHDYRIDLRAGLSAAYVLPHSGAQAERIEIALRDREQILAMRRLAAKYDKKFYRKVRAWNLSDQVRASMGDDSQESGLLDTISARLRLGMAQYLGVRPTSDDGSTEPGGPAADSPDAAETRGDSPAGG